MATGFHSMSSIYLVVAVILWSNGCFCVSSESPEKDTVCTDIKISGPGFDDPDLILPSRYFFIQVSDGCDLQSYSVTIQSPLGLRDCPLKLQVLRETFQQIIIVRYRLLDVYCRNGLLISVLLNESQVLVQKEISGLIRSEDCYCPIYDFSLRMGCADDMQSSRIQEDLKPFQHNESISFNEWLNEAVKRFAGYPRSYSFCHYKIISNQLYRRCYGEYVGFAMFSDEFLKSLLRKTPLSDTQFLVNLGDWPLSSRKDSLMPLPIFSWCGSTDTYDLVLPTYEMTESVLQSQARVSVDIMAILGRQNIPFDQKVAKVFFRGRDSNRIRLLLVLFSKKTPELIDAAITNFFFFRSEEDLEKYGPTVDHVSIFDFFNYKYLISIDGTVAAYRLPNLLAGSSLVLKQNSKYYEHFYHQLKPFEHFVPLSEDLTDFYDVLSRLTNESRSDHLSQYKQKKIVHQANQFVLDHLLPANIYCYYYSLITEYSKILSSQDKVTVTQEDEHIDNSHETCDCEAIDSQIKTEL